MDRNLWFHPTRVEEPEDKSLRKLESEKNEGRTQERREPRKGSQDSACELCLRLWRIPELHVSGADSFLKSPIQAG